VAKQESLTFCEHCVFGKQHRVSFGTGVHRTKDTLGYIYSDIWGPSQVPSKGETSYLLILIDDYFRKFVCILSSIRAMYLPPSSNGRL